MDVERWDAWLERLIVTLVGAALGFAIIAFGGVRIREFLVVESLVALAALAWLVRLWTVRSHRLLWPPVCWALLAWLAWAAWRTLTADVAYVAHGEGLRIATYATLFLVVVNNLHRQGTAQGLAWFLVGLTTLLCFYGAWQFASGSNTVWGLGRSENYVRRASGSYASPNHFAGLIVLLLPVCLAVLIAGRMKPLGRVLLGYALLMLLGGLVLTFSRGGWIAAAAGLVLVLLSLARQRDYRWLALGSLAFLLIGASAVALRTGTMQQRLATSHDLDPGSRNARPHLWRAALGMWRDHPWLGVGPAHYAERFKQYRTFWAHGEPERAHNDYLDALADWGVAGTAAAALPWLLLGYGVARTLRQVRRDPGDLEIKRSSRYAFVLGTTAGLVGLLVHGLVDFNFHIPANALIAVTWMGLLAGYSRYATDDWWVSSHRPWRIAITLVLLPLLLVLVLDLSRRGRETFHLETARRAPVGSASQSAALLAAWKVEPRNAWTAYHLGEALRLRSFTGTTGYQDLARQAIHWFETAARLNPYQPAFPLRAGMCLDWLGEHDAAALQYQRGQQLDPEGRITSFLVGWHHFQRNQLPEARTWFTKAIEQGWPPYEPAVRYLQLTEQRLQP